MPQITFFSLSDDVAIPIKIFVNRRSIYKQASKSVTINQMSIIKLKKINHIRLSSNDLQSLFDNIGKQINYHLLESTIAGLVEQSESNNRNQLDITISNTEWECNLVTHVSDIASLRQGLGKLNENDMELLEKKKIKSINLNKNRLGLLTKDISFTFNEDEKKSISYTLNRARILHDFNHCFNLYINRAPSK